MIGSHVGDYEIISSLGKGGFGSVWKAKSDTGELVAMKLLNPQALDNQRVVKKFFHEAMILAKLDHPNITKLMEFFPDGDNYAIVMEYVEGTELKKILQQHNGPLPFDQAYKIAHQALEAFQYANDNGILHRDIKPGNIIIDTNGNAKIMDFGIAKMSSTASHDTAASMLSIHYVPPERFDKNREIDARSDIYSLALVFYEMFAGRRPFDATETSQIMFAHLNEIPELPTSFSPNLPKQISDAISQALEKAPEDRFPNFREFAKAMTIDQAALDDATMVFDDEDATLIGTPLADKTMTAGEAMPLSAPAEAPAAAADAPAVDAPVKKKPPMGMIIGAVAALLIAGGVGGFFMMKPSQTASTTESTAGAPGQNKQATQAADKVGVKNSKGFFEIKHPADASAMIHVPAGEFTMGSDRYSAEKPIQKIFLDDFYIDKYLVTNAQFQKFITATGYKTNAEKDGGGLVRIGRRFKKVDVATWKMPDGITAQEGKGNTPVSQVSQNDARSYCEWAKKTLPTEAQWEKSARGPDGNEYPWGSNEPDDTLANFDNYHPGPTPVDMFDKGQSAYGMFDAAGNVYQWMKDWYAEGQRAVKNPSGPAKGDEKVVKGGSFVEGMESLRSANRDRYPPNRSMYLFGFRCAAPFPIEGLK
ncbi:MAG: SUMF1/EgtB/PvdO family nonheme iron enzyme [Pseudomonadota bacterium]